MPGLWKATTVGPYTFQLLNLDHPEMVAEVRKEMAAGVDVYYDNRWAVTERFCHILLAHKDWFADRSALVLGAGVGLETLVLGRLCRTLYLNDRAPVALELCARQLRHNGIRQFELLPGRFEEIDCPPVDIVVGSYLVYSPEIALAVERFMQRYPYPVLLMNGPMPNFDALAENTSRKTRSLSVVEGDFCILFERSGHAEE